MTARSTKRRPSGRTEDIALVLKIHELSERYPCFGYRTIASRPGSTFLPGTEQNEPRGRITAATLRPRSLARPRGVFLRPAIEFTATIRYGRRHTKNTGLDRHPSGELRVGIETGYTQELRLADGDRAFKLRFRPTSECGAVWKAPSGACGGALPSLSPATNNAGR